MGEDTGVFIPERIPSRNKFEVETLGSTAYPSPLHLRESKFVDEEDRILAFSRNLKLIETTSGGEEVPSFEPAGPRSELYFSPDRVSCGIITCGGLCPGLNDVIRSIVLTSWHGYGIRRILGFRYGYKGLSSDSYQEPMFLDPDIVKIIHQHGGTILGSSRGPQDLSEMVDTLVKWKVNVLFAIGGDGTLRGARALWDEIKERNLKISLIGIPKTIDNDLLWVQRSFGFTTAVEEAQTVLNCAHREAEAAWNGVGLVKLMGRHAGFITASATLTNGDVDFCMVPEVPFTMVGQGGFLDALQKKLEKQRHAVVVVAEGAGQELLSNGKGQGVDASGNIKFRDIGLYFKDRIQNHFSSLGWDFTVKYIDPSYTIRSLRANSMDSAFCLILGQHAVHAAMAGKTNMMVGYWNDNFTHVPLPLSTGGRKSIDPHGEVWQRVLDTTHQPYSLVGKA
jgi:6-phosphofructokinase 1